MLALLISGQRAVVRAQQRASGDLTRYSLDELMNIEVSSVSRKEQKLSQTAAAIYVITQDDIRRSGANSVPDLLRNVPGLHVAQIDSSKWAISARGFNMRFADKMLVLIDGRSVYTNLYSGTYWDQNDVMIEDIERIEVIRGPGATMWGANAVNGVINIITKSAEQTQGAMVALQGETDASVSAAMRYGGKAGDKLTYRLHTRLFRRGAGVDAGGAGAGDQWNAGRGGARLDIQLSARDTVTLDGDLYSENAHQRMNGGFPLPSGPVVHDQFQAEGGFALARWRRILSGRSDLVLQGYWSRENRDELLGALKSWNGDIEFQHRFQPFSRHDVSWGAGYRRNNARVNVSPTALVGFDPAAGSSNLSSWFVQDEVSFVEDRLYLTLGSKFLHNTYSGFEIQPSARLAWMPARHLMLWGAASHAVRTPTRRDRDLFMNLDIPLAQGMVAQARLRGNRHIQAERMNAYEGGVKIQPSSRIAFDVAGFANRYAGLEEVAAEDPVFSTNPFGLVIPMQFANTGRTRSHGLEASSTWTVRPNVTLTGGYSWLDVIPASGTGFSIMGELADPAHQALGRVSWEITPRMSFDGGAHWISRIEVLNLDAQTRVDAGLVWKLTPHLELGAGGRNLLRPRLAEYGSTNDYTVVSLRPRTAYLRLVWHF
jgi:iron complex outermembrane receptor protein